MGWDQRGERGGGGDRLAEVPTDCRSRPSKESSTLYALRYEWGGSSFSRERVDSTRLARLINPDFTPFTMQHERLELGPQLSLLFLHSVTHINFYIDIDSWNCSSMENARSREAPEGIESSSRLDPKLTASILRRKSCTLSCPSDGESTIY